MYDVKCFELASQFLDDEPEIKTDANVSELAQRIQDSIEQFIEEKRG